MRESEDRSERLLTVLVLQSMKGSPTKEKAFQLSLAGFSNIEIANLLDTSPQVVANYLSELRKAKAIKAPRAKASQAKTKGSNRKRAVRGKR